MIVPPHDELQGWLSDAEAAELVRQTRGKTVLEVGTWKGRSAVVMALNGAARVVCVDHFRGDAYAGAADTLADWRRQVEVFGVRDRVHVLVGDFRAVLPLLALAAFEVIYYDADHEYEPTRDALRLALAAAPGAVMCVHDYAAGYPQVIRAVDEAAAGTGRRVRVIDTLAVLETP
ncbi:class I SAM-dependent methyltransferase [Fimbriiglobus ruber]|uniref:Class I SAM-dependent methyltransferase n=1 Tax=Fimbriiglobus ruber TaxID=1908690 RepID=A0A225DAX6_9BACT|nr:class I SAM-dependent methyltransferase [Fimbriiglobus ruber]OWK38123.1 hypothetical protein FRUB_07243 [Fimbriiglobus ruber]